MTENDIENLVNARTSDGVDLHGNVSRLSRYEAAFVLQNPGVVLHASQVLEEFQITLNNKLVYSGKAVVRSIVNTDTELICEASLEDAWHDLDFTITERPETVTAAFREFYAQWEKNFCVDPDYKLVIAELQTFLVDLRLWLEQIELAIRSSPSGDRLKLEKSILKELGPVVMKTIDRFFDKYEAAAARIEDGQRAYHYNYMKRQIHPSVLCAPFAYRTFFKPLGYAGDYEMVEMIIRDPYEGASMYAKIINYWFLEQAPALAHRNRLTFLAKRLHEETARASTDERKARILNLGCGPAFEVKQFIRDSALSDRAQVTLWDFNDETLENARASLDETKRTVGRDCEIVLEKRSVQQVLRNANKIINRTRDYQYDFIYCAGLYDYLVDPVCQRLISVFYNWLAPGGLVLVTNVDTSNPRLRGMEALLDWHLIYRDTDGMEALIPANVPRDEVTIHTELSGVNIIMEIRKPTDE